ncbi:Rid family detoxifying hydrolase [Thioclava litoralis]|uniref:Rid family detoxifying hydrolase n=1 Tax=Thioclava litoralis TaxID=3076557 RepID=A0ABZ1E1N4_9RHOB|nr:Rid family detoxifying hydrolase [Thioclava sp. FTW29]
MYHEVIESPDAPLPLGTYTQARKAGNMIFLSGQAPIDPVKGSLAACTSEVQIRQCLKNLAAVAGQAGGSLDDVVKVTVYLTDFDDFPLVNLCMAEVFSAPYPARSAVGAVALPAGGAVAIEAIMVLGK